MPEQNIFQKALDKTIKFCGVTARWLAEKSSTSESNLSKFRLGGRDIYTDTLAKYFEGLPIEGKKYFLEEVLGETVTPRERSLTEMIKRLDLTRPEDRQVYAEAFKALSDRFTEFEKVAQVRDSSLSKGREHPDFSENTDEMVPART